MPYCTRHRVITSTYFSLLRTLSLAEVNFYFSGFFLASMFIHLFICFCSYYSRFSITRTSIIRTSPLLEQIFGFIQRRNSNKWLSITRTSLQLELFFIPRACSSYRESTVIGAKAFQQMKKHTCRKNCLKIKINVYEGERSRKLKIKSMVFNIFYIFNNHIICINYIMNNIFYIFNNFYIFMFSTLISHNININYSSYRESTVYISILIHTPPLWIFLYFWCSPPIDVSIYFVQMLLFVDIISQTLKHSSL